MLEAVSYIDFESYVTLNNDFAPKLMRPCYEKFSNVLIA